MDLSLGMSDKVVVVTGGTRGVGAGIVRTYLEAGAIVESCARSVPAQSEPGVGDRHRTAAVDVRESDSVRRWIDDVVDRHGRIDVLVNNAGGSPFADFTSGSHRFHEKVLSLNFSSAVHLCLAAHDALAAAPQSSVVNITSISARRPSPGTAVYGAAKAALESLTTSLAVEWAPGIRVNAISCGLVATADSIGHYGTDEQLQKVASTIPRGRLATPEEIGHACLLLTTPLASHITGAVLNVDGGGEWPAFLEHTPNIRALRSQMEEQQCPKP
jgi:NAD(P)-dependent dehydrogenase (short-subunit alcohol dehydrogenase family)